MKSCYRCFFDFAREERWLADMARQGYALSEITCLGRYTFQPSDGTGLVYRMDYRVFGRTDDYGEYLALFEDSGWRHLRGSKSSGVQYFVQSKEGAPEDIFSDKASRAGRYQRLSAMWLSLFAAFVPIVVALAMTNAYGLAAFTSPKALYLTPGLWQMSGARFWAAFLFETPFAVGRGFSWVLVLLPLILYLIAFLKSRQLYRQYLKDQ